MENKKVFLTPRTMVSIAMAATISFVLMQFNFNLPIAPSFVKLDIADVPALIMTFSIGPLAGAATELLKNLLHLFTTSTAGVGELSNFLLGCLLVVPAGIIYKRNKTRKNALIAMLVGTLCMAVGGIFSNLFIMFPFYTVVSGIPMEAIIAMCSKILPFVDSEAKVILLSVTPFNVLKGLIVSLITFLLYKHLTPIIRGKQ